MKRLFIIFISLLSFVCKAEEKRPVVFYLKNLPVERIGEYSDERIKADLTSEGYIVIDVDCSSFPKTSPELEDALVQFHDKSHEKYSSYENTDKYYVYYVPEGYTIKRNVPVWNIQEHGAEGSVDYVVKQWNNVIVKEHGVQPVTSADQMYNPDGSPIDWWLRMDIIYPSGKAAAKVPLVMNLSSNSPRWRPFASGQSKERVYRSIFPMGFLTTGYAFANVDHCYVPLARGETWGYFDNYSLDDQNGLAANTAYVRYLRVHQDDYNLNGKIGVMGISKASYGAMRLADPNNASGSEFKNFNNTPNNRQQPWSEGESSVDVSYAAAGNGTKRLPDYINSGCVPMLTSAGFSDEYNQWDVYPRVVKHLNDIDHIHYPFWMQDLGHTYPGLGVDLATGESRYVVFKRFFDHFLKPSETTKADVFCIFPKEGASNVDALGISRILPSENFLPQYMLGLQAKAPLTVRFLEEYTVEAISDAVRVTSVDNATIVEGEWKASMKNTCFCFTPFEPMEKGETYRVTVPVTLRSVSGASPSAEVVRDFTVSSEADLSGGNGASIKIHKVYPIDDTYTKYEKNTKVRGTEETMKVRYSKYNDYRFVGYFKFDLTQIDTVRVRKITINLALSSGESSILSSEAGSSVKVNFHKSSTDWDEDELVQKISMESQYFAQTVVTPETEWIELDVTDLVAGCLEKGETTLSIAADVPNTESSSHYVYFFCKETNKESVRPFMSVERSLPSSPTIHVNRIIPSITDVKLRVAVEYEDEINSVIWYVDDVRSDSDLVRLSSGMHKIMAVVEGPEKVGTDIIVKYVSVQ